MAVSIFYLTHPDEATAERVGAHLLENRLVACVHLYPIASRYRWKGELQRETEWVSIVKTRPELEAAVEAAVRAVHPYEVPCIARFQVQANADYETWIRAETREG
jgi:periplasmic divalent cation tolerance protein